MSNSKSLPPSSPLKRALDTYLPFLYRPLRSVYQAVQAHRFARRYRRLVDKFVAACGRSVQSGPFLNIRYLDHAYSSALLPKLLGTYEDELHPYVRQFLAKPSDTIIDIGCAEGYYAVGLALTSPTSRVLAYDIDPAARASCRELAELNGVADRVTIKAGFEPTEMQPFADLHPLVICDVDGYETELFSLGMESYWRGADLIVELHDYLGIPCRETVERCLRDTHDIEIVASRDKSEDRLEHLEFLSSDERRLAVNELRPPQHWLIASPK